MWSGSNYAESSSEHSTLTPMLGSPWRPPWRRMVLAADLRAALDPALIMQATGVTPDPWQRALLRARAQQMLLLCCRQAGKTRTSAAMAVNEAAHRAPALVLILA